MYALAKKLGITVDEAQTGISNKVIAGALGVSFVGLGLFGLWVVACIVGGLIAAGGPLAFVKAWFGAVMGG